ncbi:caspase family protein [Spirosoma sordidisoli]|uniref:Tetratricopeptide repeat protein n=1 Tax=Spirosoma sordidisoli TaxID=2502893 RepID=A0A4Q2UQV6_9BACT|nr:caspase family protein [Spirosoma sordidisoli]RYC69189.1 tetratricopeptide repeat protein [Spirosoma sordidisoli]
MNVFFLPARPLWVPLLPCLIFLLAGSLAQAQTVQQLLDRADREPDPAQAVSLYTALLRAHPDVADAYYGRAVVLTKIGRFPEALRDANQALERTPTAVRALAQRAYIHVQLNDYDQAAADYRSAIRLSPQAEYYSGLSYCLTKHNRLDEAEQVAQQGIDLNRTSPYAYRNRGRARLHTGRTDMAIADFETSLRLQHAQPYRLYTDLGEAYEQKNMPEKALGCYRQALELNASYVDARVRKTILEQQLNVGSSLPVATFSGRRVALVLGNSAYLPASAGGLGDLRGQPVNDARAMRQRLTELGFTVQISTDVSYEAMRQTMEQFYKQAQGADVALLFYAGHGIEYAQTNYLLPVDIRFGGKPVAVAQAGGRGVVPEQPTGQADNAGIRAISVATVLDRLQDQQPRFCIIIMDACRTAPAGIQAELRPGFSPVRVENRIDNCYVASATAWGATASNGPNQNGYYTEALLKFMRRGQRFDDILAHTRGEVEARTSQTGSKQSPEFTNRAIERIIL